MAGAYTAMSDEASVLWYNPAGLAYNSRSSLDVSATTYSLELGRVPGFVSTVLPSGTKNSDLEVSSVSIVPNALTYVINLDSDKVKPRPCPPAPGSADMPQERPPLSRISQSVALGVFAPTFRKFANTFTVESDEGSFTWRNRFRIDTTVTEYYAGPSWAIRFGDALAFGASIYATYLTGNQRATFDLGIRDKQTGREAFLIERSEIDATNIGWASVIGVQARPISNLRIGVSVRPPRLTIHRDMSSSSAEAFANGTPASDRFNDQRRTESKWESRQISGVRLRGGVAWVEPERFAVATDVEYRAAFQNDDQGIDERAVTNVRAGTEIFVVPRHILSLGFFTDFSPAPPVEAFGEMKINFYGGTVAFTRITDFDVVGSDKTDRISFSATVGLKYAFGTGQVGGMVMNPNAAEFATQQTLPAKFHDFAVMLGSGVRF
jgi:hypothetical protein